MLESRSREALDMGSALDPASAAGSAEATKAVESGWGSSERPSSAGSNSGTLESSMLVAGLMMNKPASPRGALSPNSNATDRASAPPNASPTM
eukprot:2355015-Prymnesium_polylepis.1